MIGKETPQRLSEIKVASPGYYLVLVPGLKLNCKHTVRTNDLRDVTTVEMTQRSRSVNSREQIDNIDINFSLSRDDDRNDQHVSRSNAIKGNHLIMTSNVTLPDSDMVKHCLQSSVDKNRQQLAKECHPLLCKWNPIAIKDSWFTWATSFAETSKSVTGREKKAKPRVTSQPKAVYDGHNFDELLPGRRRTTRKLFFHRQSYTKSGVLILLISILQFSISFSHCSTTNDTLCNNGFYLTGDDQSGKLCKDINECAPEVNPCEHHCINSIGSFQCLCYPGFRLSSDRVSCISQDPVIFYISSQNKMYSITMGGDDLSKKLTEPTVVFEANSDIVSFSLSVATNEIYYVEMLDGLWVYNTNTGLKSRKTSGENGHSQNITIPNAKLRYNWGDSSLLMAVDLRILKFKEQSLDPSFFISEVYQRISDFAIDPINKWLFITELGAQPRLIIHHMDSKSKLHDFVAPLTNTYIQTEFKISTNIYDSQVYLVTSTGSMESCQLVAPDLLRRSYSSEEGDESLRCDTLLAEGNVSSQVVSYGNNLYFLSADNQLVYCDRRSCYNSMRNFSLNFKPKEIAMWSTYSQMLKTDAECHKCDEKKSTCRVYDDWFTKCECKPGFLTSQDGSCEDVNECEDAKLNLCEDECINTEGSFYCRCSGSNSVLSRDGFTCDTIMQSCSESRCSHGCVENTTTISTARDDDYVISVGSESSGFGSPTCTCPVGSYLKEDKYTCTGCRAGDNGGCSHICNETGISSFECACPSGYVMGKDKKTCAVDWNNMIMITASDSNLKIWNLGGSSPKKAKSLNSYWTIHNLRVKDMSLDQEHGILYYNTGTYIGKLDIHTSKYETLFAANGQNFTSIAIDWYYDTLYLTEQTNGSIIKIKLKTSTTQQYVVATDLKNPRELTIDSDTGFLYFVTDSDTHEGKNSLMQLSLSTNILLTLSSTMNDTRSLTIDYMQQMLYFSDVKNGKIQSVSIEQRMLDRGDSPEILTNNDVAFVYNLQIIQDTIYTLDVFRRWKVVTYSKITGKKIDNLSKNKRNVIGNLNKFIVAHRNSPINDRRPEYGPCSVNNGGCSHICEDFLNRVVCSCYENYTLVDKHECALEEPSSSTSQEADYEANKVLQPVPETNCSSRGLLCHKNAQCMQRSSGLLVCRCQQGFYGDGINSCRDESLQCTAEDIKEADCGKHGSCRKEKIIGTSFMLSCRCEAQWTGKKCWEFTGRRRRVFAHPPEPDYQITFSQKVQLSLLLAFTVALITGFLFLLIFRQRYRERAVGKNESRRHSSFSNPNIYNLDSANYSIPKSPAVLYIEVACSSPVNEFAQVDQSNLLVSAVNTSEGQWKTKSTFCSPKKLVVSTHLTPSRNPSETDVHLTQLHENTSSTATATPRRKSCYPEKNTKHDQHHLFNLSSTPNRRCLTNPRCVVGNPKAASARWHVNDPNNDVITYNHSNVTGRQLVTTSALGTSSRKAETNLMRTSLDVTFEDELIAR